MRLLSKGRRTVLASGLGGVPDGLGNQDNETGWQRHLGIAVAMRQCCGLEGDVKSYLSTQ